VVTDAGLVADPDTLVAGFQEELRAMMAAPEEVRAPSARRRA